MKPLEKRDRDFIAETLARLRDHFSVWKGYEGRDRDLIEFAYYEGCTKGASSGLILAQAAPFALGQELVDHYGFEWGVVERRFEVATFAVHHPNLDEPIDLLTLEDGKWYEADERDDERLGQEK